MTAWAIITAFALLAPIAGVWPIRIWGNAYQNSVWFIRMRRPVAGQFEPHQSIFAQEVVEFWLRWLIACTAALPVAWILRHDPMADYLAAVAVLLGHLLMLPLIRQIELIGHAAELVHAKAGPEYEAVEVRGMIRNYKCFANDTQEGLTRAVRRRFPIARLLVGLLWLRIRREA
jgi:hypothetical protein